MSLTAGTKVIVTKGSPARSIYKDEIAYVQSVELLPSGHAYAVKVALYVTRLGARTVSFYLKNAGQLSDREVSMSDLDGHKLRVRRA